MNVMMKKQQLTFLCFLAFLRISVLGQEGLFISEITDPLDDYSGRYVELYNAGSVTVDFNTDTFYLSRQSNGGTGWGDIQLSGFIGPGEVFVIGGSLFESIYGFAPDVETGILIGNGDDAYMLYAGGDHSTGTLHDIYGVPDTDGTGEAWEYEDSRATRLSEVVLPNILWTASEWEIIPANIADCTPGTHSIDGAGGGNPSPGIYTLTVVNDTVVEGQLLNIPIRTDTLSPEDNIISYQFDVYFDHTAIAYSDINISGTISENGSIVLNSNIEGKLSISYMNAAILVGSGSLLEIRFNTLHADTSLISLSNAFLNNTEVSELFSGEGYIMPSTPPSAIVTYNDTAIRYADTLLITATYNEAMDESYEVQLTLSGSVSLINAAMSRQSDSVYTYSFPVPKAEGNVYVSFKNGRNLRGIETDSIPLAGETFSILRFTPGDVDDDGSIMAYDAALALQHSVGLDPLPAIDPLPWEPWRDSTANVDGTGAITANDAGLILQYSAGLIQDFSAGVKKSASGATISIEIEGGELVFYSRGNLRGFNLKMKNENAMLGIPEFHGNKLLTAININASQYNIGICFAVPPEDGNAFLKIPILNSGSTAFKYLVNTDEKAFSFDYLTGMNERIEEELEIYPIPANAHLIIKTGKYNARDAYSMRIIRLNGDLVFDTSINSSVYTLDTGMWSGHVLFLQVLNSRGMNMETRKIILK